MGRAILRPRTRIGRIAIASIAGLVGVTGAAALLGAVSRGIAPTRLDLTDGGTWLPTTATGTLIHLSGPAGRANAAVTVPGTAGNDLAVTTTSARILVSEGRAGRVHLVDPARLALVRTADLGPGVTIIAAGRVAYALDATAGRVQQLSPDDLSPTGRVLALPAPLGGVALARSGDGTLWVPLRATGEVVAVRDGVARRGHRPVAPPGNAADIILVDDRPVAVDATAGTLTVLDPEDPGRWGRVIPLLPGEAPRPPERPLLVAPRTDGGPVPLLDPASRRLFLVDVIRGQVTGADLPSPARPDETGFGTPLVHAGHAYVPDSGGGVVLDYDLARGRFAEPVRLAGPDGNARLTATADSGQVWINDAAGPDAVMINERGRTLIAKQPPDLPGLPTGTARPLPAAPPLPAPEPARPAGRGEAGGAASTRPPVAGRTSAATDPGPGPGTGADLENEPERPTPGLTASPSIRPSTPPPSRPPPPPPPVTVTVPPVGTPSPSPTPVPPSATPDGLPLG
ncbi:hypothetical protein [Parafrankia sp. FMc2]|uniref:hypothetical protein n=1 Tax=Parafrankia sp. FMc2 TaxID=3233196 RepID=UPI0034D705AC